VREAFRARGHDAWSCDLLETEIPGQHIVGDVLGVIGDGWDLMIAHPPCTHLAVSGAVAAGFLAWVEGHLEPPAGQDGRELAALLLAAIDGMMLLDAVGLGEACDAATAAGAKLV